MHDGCVECDKIKCKSVVNMDSTSTLSCHLLDCKDVNMREIFIQYGRYWNSNQLQDVKQIVIEGKPVVVISGGGTGSLNTTTNFGEGEEGYRE